MTETRLMRGKCIFYGLKRFQASYSVFPKKIVKFDHNLIVGTHIFCFNAYLEVSYELMRLLEASKTQIVSLKKSFTLSLN